MGEATWRAVDAYFASRLADEDPVMAGVLRANAEAGLPAYDVSLLQGKFLHVLARGCRAKRILEIGTLGGYSSIWMARAMDEGGRLVTLEIEAGRAEVARRNFERAGVAEKIEVRVGEAASSLAQMLRDGEPLFDLVFIDADKVNNGEYVKLAVELAHEGALILVDNVVRDGEVLDEESSDPSVQGVRAAVEVMREHPRLEGTAVQTVGSKGHDGFLMAYVKN